MKYILYARKSTEEDDRQVLSIEAQLVELQEYAAKEKLEIVAFFFAMRKQQKNPGNEIRWNVVIDWERKSRRDYLVAPRQIIKKSILQNIFYIKFMKFSWQIL